LLSVSLSFYFSILYRDIKMEEPLILSPKPRALHNKLGNGIMSVVQMILCIMFTTFLLAKADVFPPASGDLPEADERADRGDPDPSMDSGPWPPGLATIS
jgi:hypothetical protein